MSYYVEGRYGEAARSLEKAIELKPSFYGKAHENMDMVASGMKTGE